jgi:hypothetical protein
LRYLNAYGEDRVRAAPEVSCALMHEAKNAHEHTGSAVNNRPSLRNGVTAYFVLSPVNGLSCHCHRRDAKHHRRLDASVAASGPHDFAVRFRAVRQERYSHPSLPAPNVRDDRETPLWVGTGYTR